MISNVSDFATYLGVSPEAFDASRGNLMLTLAEQRCGLILNPLPPEAVGIVYDVAQRAYLNVAGASAIGTGPYSASLPSIGVSLTSANRRELRLLGGGGGAFTVDPTPADAGTGTPVWEQNITWLDDGSDATDPDDLV